MPDPGTAASSSDFWHRRQRPIRLEYRGLNGARNWMEGLNAGYDSSSMNTERTDTSMKVESTEKSAFILHVIVNTKVVCKT